MANGLRRAVFFAVLATALTVFSGAGVVRAEDDHGKRDQAKAEMRAMEDRHRSERRALEDKCEAEHRSMKDKHKQEREALKKKLWGDKK